MNLESQPYSHDALCTMIEGIMRPNETPTTPAPLFPNTDLVLINEHQYQKSM
jgi:hypothetical protein